jgi:ABC-type antimicrobial peptide transport system permease subunit
VDRAALQTTIAGNPLQVTIAGLLLAGAVIAALLALLGSVIQATSAARLRTVQFAVLRTLGMGRAQLARMLLGELFAVYAYGLVGGTLLGAVLATATLPYLQFSTVAVDSGTQGTPPPMVALNPTWIALFYVALVGALALALLLTARYAAVVKLEQSLRRAED